MWEGHVWTKLRERAEVPSGLSDFPALPKDHRHISISLSAYLNESKLDRSELPLEHQFFFLQGIKMLVKRCLQNSPLK